MNKNFKVTFIEPDEAELVKIGFDETYTKQGLNKHKFVSVKIYNLSPAQANILKQTALSTGTDCAVHREVITGKTESSDCILSGSISELKKIAEKLKFQPFKLNALGQNITALIEKKLEKLKIRDVEFEWKKRSYVMGIVNVTPDSFSDGGNYQESQNAIEHAIRLVEEGADIIDIGGESTRPYSKKVSIEEEISRVIPVIQGIRAANQNIPISIDTRNSRTAKAALEAGADIINDVSACDCDKNMPAIAKEYNCPIILNHAKGTPDIMQENTVSDDIVVEIYDYFSKKTETLTEFGINPKNLIIDVGIGFGKNTEQNFELIKKIHVFDSLGFPILVGHSRKTFLQNILETKDNADLDIATNAVSTLLMSKKVDIIRVHNVKQLKIAMEIFNIVY